MSRTSYKRKPTRLGKELWKLSRKIRQGKLLRQRCQQVGCDFPASPVLRDGVLVPEIATWSCRRHRMQTKQTLGLEVVRPRVSAKVMRRQLLPVIRFGSLDRYSLKTEGMGIETNVENLPRVASRL